MEKVVVLMKSMSIQVGYEDTDNNLQVYNPPTYKLYLMGSPKEWEKEVYVTAQIRRYDKQRMMQYAFPKEPNWKTQARILDIIDKLESMGGIKTIERKLAKLKRLEQEL